MTIELKLEPGLISELNVGNFIDFVKERDNEIRIHNKIITYYEDSLIVRNFLSDFFKLRKGYRPLAIQKRYPKQTNPFAYYPKSTKRLIHFDELGLVGIYKNVGQMHFFEYIFDEGIKDWKLIEKEIDENLDDVEKYGLQVVFDKHIIGASITFDIDAPKEPVTRKKRNFFDVYEEYMQMKLICENISEEYGFRHNALFTGNGVDIILESYYFDEIDEFDGGNGGDRLVELYEFKDNIDNMMLKMNFQYSKKVGIFDKTLVPHVDDRFKSWWSYNKCPFTYHNKWNRMTIPLKDGYIDKEWLLKYSDFNCVIDNRLEDEIIKEANWRRLW